MKLLDANLLIYAVNQDARSHPKAKVWIEETLSGSQTVGFSWNVILAFLRISTRSDAFRNPLPVKDALNLVGAWLDAPVAIIVHPGALHFKLLRDLLQLRGMGGNLTSDAHLAALAIENNAELCTADADFARFPGLRWQNPIA